MNFFLTRRFFPLFATQFLGAFNDNFLKNALIVLITYRLAAQSGMNAGMLVAMAAGIFILPYFLFSAMAGQIADKIERGRITHIIKLVETGLMILATIGFYFGNIWFLFAVLFGMGIHSTFFGPIKYALLPQHLTDEELLPGNGAIEAGTFLAILLGTIGGGLTILHDSGTFLTGGVLIAVAVTGYLASRFIPAAPAPDPQMNIGWNIFSQTGSLLKEIHRDKRIMRAIHGISWFWFIGATFLAQFPTIAKDVLHSDAVIVTLFLTTFSIGVGIGSLLCNFLKGKEPLRLVIPAAITLSIFMFDLAWSLSMVRSSVSESLIGFHEFMQVPLHWKILIDLFGVSVGGGLYIVPLYTFLQEKGDDRIMARLIAGNNVVNAIYMVVSALLLMVVSAVKLSVPYVFIGLGVINLLVTTLSKPRDGSI